LPDGVECLCKKCIDKLVKENKKWKKKLNKMLKWFLI
jgi:hypothetical protein